MAKRTFPRPIHVEITSSATGSDTVSPPHPAPLPPMTRISIGHVRKFLFLMSIAIRKPRVAALAACVCLGPVLTAAQAADKPLWELGAGVSALAFPDYRGSDQTRNYALPIPYVVYRGEFFKADRDGVRGIFFDIENVEIHASVGAAFPVDSSDNDARSGMPDLKPTVELGPAVDITLWRAATAGMKL